MTKTGTIKLIKKHTHEYNEYMKKNGEFSFHRFTDGSIHHTKPMFIAMNALEEIGITPLRPVREFEQLVEASKDDDALITINDSIRFKGLDIILDDTEILFCNSSVRIEYTGIHSIHVDYNHDLKNIITCIKRGNFGGIVCIERYWVGINYLNIEENGISIPAVDEKGKSYNKYINYDRINSISDEDGHFIYWRSEK